MGWKQLLFDSSTEESDPGVVQELEEMYGEVDRRVPGAAVLETDIHRNKRILFYEYGCEFCYEWLQVVDSFNQKLDRRAQRVRKIDVEGPHPEVNSENGIGNNIPGTPSLYIDGILVVGVTSEGFARGFLNGFLEDELMVD